MVPMLITASTVNFLDGEVVIRCPGRFGTRNPIYYLVEGSGLALGNSWAMRSN